MKQVRILCLYLSTLSIFGCAAREDQELLLEELTAETIDALSSAVFSGTVITDQGTPIAGASVLINGVLRTTNSAGQYFYSAPNAANGYTISVEKTGFAPVAQFFSAGKLNIIHTLSAAYVQQVNPTQANNVVSPTGVTVALQPNSLVDANGAPVTAPVNISVATYNPLRMPGDFTAVNAAGAQVALESVGAISVSATLASSGAPLKLKPGATAVAFIPVSPEVGTMPSCVGSVACRLAMWRFNTTTGKWNEQPADIQFSASGTTFTMVGSAAGASFLGGNGGLGTWNADIEKTAPACTVVEFSGFPDDCFNPNSPSSTQPGITLQVKLPNASSTLISKSERVDSATPFVALYNLRPNAVQEIGITFPAGAPAYCVGNLTITSSSTPVSSYPSFSSNGGVTRFDSGAPWGGVGFPKNAAGKFISLSDMPSNHPCSYVSFETNNTPTASVKTAMTWHLSKSAAPSASNAYVLVGSDSITDPYQGDTSTKNSLPVLCINKNNPPYPGGGVLGNPHQTPGGAWRGTWSGGTAALTSPVQGLSLTSLTVANDLCATQFGAGYRMAEFHDGDPTLWSGWDFWAEARNASITPFQNTRFWVSINDQNANPW